VGGGGDRDIERARTVARWLDDRFVDPIVGLLVPGAGDLASSLAGLYVVGVAARRRLPAVVIARMFLNLAIDSAVGAIPLAGDAFDLFFKANRRNLALLERRWARGRAAFADWVVVIGAARLFVLAVALPIWLVFRLIAALV
jgi:hypothetical protein